MKIRMHAIAAGLALATPLLAQTPPEALQRALQQIEQLRLDLIGTASPIGWEAPLVAGHPYSAVARNITRSPDGKDIDRSSMETIYRDEQGRTRREINGGKNISILDPAAGIGYNLDPERKVAIKRTLAPAMIENQSKVPNQSPVEIARAQAADRHNMAVEDLGTQIVSGVATQGVRVTTTIPVGTIGNDRDLKTVVDRWVSTDLHILVKSVTTDSRSGPTTYELGNLVLGSPDPSLFQPPAGYTIQEGPGRGGRGGAVQQQPAGRK